jgi:hypothetical protein
LDAEFCGHLHQVRQRIHPHFSHHLASMRLDCDFTDAELTAYLFIQQAGDDQAHDLLFTAGRHSNF